MVAIKPTTGTNILPNLRHYLRKAHESFSPTTSLPRNFTLKGDIGVVFRPRNQADAELEYQTKNGGGVGPRKLNIVQRCLRQRMLDRLSHYIPDTDSLRSIIDLYKLRIFEAEPVDVKRKELLAAWLQVFLFS